MINIAIFASGSGTNAENIIKYFENSTTIHTKVVITNKADAFVVQRAKNLNVESKIFEKEQFNDCTELLFYLEEKQIDYIVLAGFLLKIPPVLVNKYSNRIINIHPALLPKFGGKGMYGNNVHKAVIEAKEKETGITIHFVNEEYDKGSVIFQAKTSVEPNDSFMDIASKIHELEYKYFPAIIEKTISENKN